jgi:hypothetical protein
LLNENSTTVVGFYQLIVHVYHQPNNFRITIPVNTKLIAIILLTNFPSRKIIAPPSTETIKAPLRSALTTESELSIFASAVYRTSQRKAAVLR